MGKTNIKQLAVYVPAILILAIFIFIPFHAFLTVWGNALVGHYTLLRLWKEFLLAICFIGALYIFFTEKKIRELFYYSRFIQIILLFFVIELIWGLVAHYKGVVSNKALFYGWLSDCRYMLFFLIALIVAKKTSLLKNMSIKVVIWPAVIVVLFGLLQILVLPNNFLSHFGYGPNTIPAYETINHNSQYIRIASTLRGSNPLGAYLLLPLSLAAVLLIKGRKVWQMAVFLLAGSVVMFFSFSRSAWLGFAVAIALSVYWGIKSRDIRRKLIYLAIALIVVFGALLIAERNNTRVQNIILHTQTHSAISTNSDQNHSSAITNGLKQFVKHPFGNGPGTAGPASQYNNSHPNIPENYFLQIGLETGWLGLAVFISINVLVMLSLWRRRADTLSLALLASFIGLIVCNLLLEAWTDDTIAYLWWGLAGIALATQPKLPKSSKKSAWIL